MWASVLSGAGDSIFPGAESAAPLYSGQGWGPTCCPQDKESTRLLFAGVLGPALPGPCTHGGPHPALDPATPGLALPIVFLDSLKPF
jgi:hypothetical protein